MSTKKDSARVQDKCLFTVTSYIYFDLHSKSTSKSKVKGDHSDINIVEKRK